MWHFFKFFYYLLFSSLPYLFFFVHWMWSGTKKWHDAKMVSLWAEFIPLRCPIRVLSTKRDMRWSLASPNPALYCWCFYHTQTTIILMLVRQIPKSYTSHWLIAQHGVWSVVMAKRRDPNLWYRDGYKLDAILITCALSLTRLTVLFVCYH